MPRRSKKVPANLIVALSASFAATGCGSEVTEVRNCVDSSGYLLPDNYCNGGITYYGGSYGYGGYNIYGGHRLIGRPSFVYGGSTQGTRIFGYSSVPSEGANVKTRSGTSLGRWNNYSSGSTGSYSGGGFGSGSGGGGSFGG